MLLRCAVQQVDCQELSKVELVVAATALVDMPAGVVGFAVLLGKGGNCGHEHPRKDRCWGNVAGMEGIGPCKAELEASCMVHETVAWGSQQMKRMGGPLHLGWVPVSRVVREKNEQVDM
jgi:hypothetical protein